MRMIQASTHPEISFNTISVCICVWSRLLDFSGLRPPTAAADIELLSLPSFSFHANRFKDEDSGFSVGWGATFTSGHCLCCCRCSALLRAGGAVDTGRCSALLRASGAVDTATWLAVLSRGVALAWYCSVVAFSVAHL
jgi:hypothetical protein